jgi:outer membrane receptor protein involved in Fe transport
MFYRGERFAAAYNGDSFQRLKPYFDANLSVEYRYSKMVSVFLNINNIGAVQYFKWYNYPSYRLQLLAGASLSF